MKDETVNGLMTEKMDIGSKEFKDFQLLIRAKAANLPTDVKNRMEMYTLKLKMIKYLKTNNAKTKSVGYYLKQALTRLKIKQNKFAAYINIKPPNLTKIIKDQRKINMEQALIFDKIFQIDAEIWLRIQTKKDLADLEKVNKMEYKKYSLNDLVCEG